MRNLILILVVAIGIGCARNNSPQAVETLSTKTLSGTEVTFCDEAKLNNCVDNQGGSACLSQHCNKKDYQDSVCAIAQFQDCLFNKGGTGCKKYCGHPVQCIKNQSVFDCGPGGCRCLATGAAPESELGNTFIDLIAGAGVSFTGLLIKTTVLSVTKLSSRWVTTAAVRGLASTLDDSFGTAFGMGARFGLRMTAHTHEIAENGVIRVAPNILKIKISAVKEMPLPSLVRNSENYIWIVDDAGSFIIAPEIKIAVNQTLGHPTLCGGCSGRIAGEVVKKIENGITKFYINNQSGRYFNDFEMGKKHLENSAKVLQTIVGTSAEVIVQYLAF